jgi:methionyl-tRNA synthetase
MEVVQQSNMATIEQLSAVELRVGLIERVEEIEKSDRLYKLTVSFGALGSKTICSGIKKFFTPEELQGKKVLFAYNLPPRELMGVVSEGMIMVAKNEENKAVLMVPAADVPAGVRLS